LAIDGTDTVAYFTMSKPDQGTADHALIEAASHGILQRAKIS
jgi:hypothetical protein